MAQNLSHSSVETAPKRRRKRRRTVKNGRFYIVLLFLWLRVVDVTFLSCVYPRLFQNQQHDFLGALVVTAVWTTMLLLAAWFAQNWARYLLAGSILGAVILAFASLPGLPDSLYPRRDLLIVLGFTGAYLPVALTLIISKHIRKHTSQTVEQTTEGKRAI